MSLFDGNLTEKSNHTAHELSEIELYSNDDIGMIKKSYRWRTPAWNLKQITSKELDSIIDNILSYIYYYIKIGLNCQNDIVDSHHIKISTYIFGITRRNYFDVDADLILKYVFREFQNKGFEVTFLQNDLMLIIDWDKTFRTIEEEK